MSANHHARRSPGLWRAVCRVARAFGRIHAEQVHMWDTWAQANRAAVPAEGPLRWTLTLDGHRLAGSHLSVGRETRAEGTS
jgi:transposase-like protein